MKLCISVFAEVGLCMESFKGFLFFFLFSLALIGLSISFKFEGKNVSR